MKPFPLQLEPKQSRDSSGWAKRLRLDDLPRDEKMAKKKLKLYYESLGFVNEVNSIHVPQHGAGAPFCSAIACRIIIDRATILKLADFWQTRTIRLSA